MNRRLKKRLRERREQFQQGFQKGESDGFPSGRHYGLVKGIQAALGPHALLVNPGPSPSFDIGVLQPFRQLKKQGVLNFHNRPLEHINAETIEASETVVFLRNVEQKDFSLLQFAQQTGKRTVYVIDDNFVAIPPHSPFWQYYSERRELIESFLRTAQIVLVGSPFFAEYIRIHYNANVVCIPASVDFEWIEQTERKERADRQFVIGYQGTPKEEDFAVVIPALLQILEEYGDRVRVEFYAYVPKGLAGHRQVRYLEGTPDYRVFIKQLYQTGWDIGLAPLGDNLFNYCKTNNKFREYAACRIAGIYSSTPAYTPWVTHGENGYLVHHTADSWYQGLKHMIEDAALRERIRTEAYQFAKQHFSMEACANHWKKLVLQR